MAFGRVRVVFCCFDVRSWGCERLRVWCCWITATFWSVKLCWLERDKIVVSRPGFPRVHVMRSGGGGSGYSTHAMPPLVLAPVVKTSVSRSRKRKNRRGKQFWPRFWTFWIWLESVVLCIYLRRCDGVFFFFSEKAGRWLCSKCPYFSPFFFFFHLFVVAAVMFAWFVSVWYCSSIGGRKKNIFSEK